LFSWGNLHKSNNAATFIRIYYPMSFIYTIVANKHNMQISFTRNLLQYKE